MTANLKFNSIHFNNNEAWHPMLYSNKELILVVGDMDLSFCGFVLPFLNPATIVLNTSYLSENEILSSGCEADFMKNKNHIFNYCDLYRSNRVKIVHNVDIRQINKAISYAAIHDKFDCVVFLFPQAASSSNLLKYEKFSSYCQLNKQLIQDYIVEASKIISNENGQIDFAIKYNQIEQWIGKFSDYFKTNWFNYYNITMFEFDFNKYNPYTPRHEKGYSFNPGKSVLISSKMKSSNYQLQGLNIQFERNGKLLIGNFGFGNYDARKDYKKIYSNCNDHGSKIYCSSLASMEKILFASCVATIEGEFYKSGQYICYKQVFADLQLQECDVIKNNTFATLKISTTAIL